MVGVRTARATVRVPCMLAVTGQCGVMLRPSVGQASMSVTFVMGRVGVNWRVREPGGELWAVRGPTCGNN